ncbi:helix-turn-helix transcriptional regulator [Streptomyces macrosporus]|uniref:Helix-turn-helix transcriptional regulator n=1 Tax=Streptomyces macrosporus TaxID=44032 RepID=A0ABN3KLH3_9ACTN
MDISDVPELASLSPLTEAELTVYAYAVEQSGIDGEEVPHLDVVAPDEAEAAVRSLLKRRLLLPVRDGGLRYVAVPPDAASEELARPIANRARVVRHAADRLRDELLPVYESGLERRLRRPPFEELHEVTAVRKQLDRLAAEARFEVLTSQPGGGRTEEVLQEAMARTEELLKRGVRMRTLYQHTAQFSASTVAYVEIVSRLGAEVRTLGDGFMRMIAFDRETAVIELKDNPRGALVVREPNVVAFLVSAFELMWGQGEKFPENLGRDQAILASDKTKEDIIRLLVLGEPDKVIARRMGMSVRTCQRHIAKIMERIGAKSRVHAGYLLREYDDTLARSVPARSDGADVGPGAGTGAGTEPPPETVSARDGDR